MGVCFGSGILGLLPADIEDEEYKFEFMKEFAARGLSHGFREIIGDRVAEFKYRKGEVQARWMDESEYADWITKGKRVGGSAPWSTIPHCLEGALLLPGFRGGYETHQVVIPVPNEHDFDWHAGALRANIERLEEFDLPEYADTVEWLLEDLRYCREHRLIWHIGE